MNYVHPESDLKIFIPNEELGGLPRLRFEFRYYTTDKQHFVSASFDGTTYLNCQEAAGGVWVY